MPALPRSKKPALRLPTLQIDQSDNRQMLELAERYVDKALFAVAMGHALPDDWAEMMEELVRMSRHYNPQEFSDASGDVQCACYDAGLVMGLAFGKRLGGAR